MQKRRLGSTDIEVSVIGLGTVKFGRNQGVKYPAAFDLPTDAELDSLLRQASMAGINLLDTAPAYGDSEERLGKLLSGTRQDWVICTKVGEEFVAGESRFDFSASAMVKSVERSLQRLKTDYLDIVLVHSDGDDVALIEKQGVFATLAELKQAGKIRAFGMSTKTVVGGLLTVARADVAMVSFNPAYTDERDVVAAAALQHKGILIKKALGSGHAVATPAETLRDIVATPGVSSVIIGTINPAHLKQNLTKLRSA